MDSILGCFSIQTSRVCLQEQIVTTDEKRFDAALGAQLCSSRLSADADGMRLLEGLCFDTRGCLCFCWYCRHAPDQGHVFHSFVRLFSRLFKTNQAQQLCFDLADQPYDAYGRLGCVPSAMCPMWTSCCLAFFFPFSKEPLRRVNNPLECTVPYGVSCS